MSDVVNASDYASIMVEAVENLIVKVSRVMPSLTAYDKNGNEISNLPIKIEGETLNQWKNYTLKYFRQSPNAFFVEDEFYDKLDDNMRVRIVKNQLLKDF